MCGLISLWPLEFGLGVDEARSPEDYAADAVCPTDAAAHGRHVRDLYR